MENQSKPILILMAEDDEDDRLLVQEAFEESRLANELRCVEDGEQLLAYLRHQGQYANAEEHPRPDLILLDLNMPRIDGREALREIKQDKALRRIPVVILTTSSADEDVMATYDSGVNSFIRKPVTFDTMVSVLRTVGKYWFQIVQLPSA